MPNWQKVLKHDPIPKLLTSKNPALIYFAKRDLQEETVPPIETLWKLPEVERILRKQEKDGRWKYPTRKSMQREYDKLETFRQVGILTEMHELNKKHPSIRSAVNFLFTFQTKEGDFRGIYGNQYSPNYSATIIERLIKAGYEKDKRIKKCLAWLLLMRQDDGGWVIPVRTRLKTLGEMYKMKETLQPDRSKPSSHFATDIILRAFALHPRYRKRKEVREAGNFLKQQFFKSDKYPDHKSATCWTKFQFPFWWSHLISALDSLAKIGFKKEDSDVKKGLDWFIKKQNKDGLWPTGYGSDKKNPNRRDIVPLWIGLAICRMLKGYYG
ncbi:prenyltransferase/squalene oxidase repeat-containing protein [Patescibacteria group bacterium]